MANLIIQENGAVRTRSAVNGEEITVKAPCDCSAVTGVQINGVAFPFYNAAGRSLGNITGLFAKDSLIRVMVDTDNTRAYILNADTTAYLESRFALIEGMYTHNDFFAPICTDDGTSFVIVDDDGNVIVADWFFQTEPATEEIEDPTAIFVDKATGCLYREFDGKVEWFNPPMKVGVEYRTTERFNGKPVYIRMVDIGELPNTSTKLVVFISENRDCIVGISGDGAGHAIPYVWDQTNYIYARAYIGPNDSIYTEVKTGKDYSAYTAKVWVKYTKTTD